MSVLVVEPHQGTANRVAELLRGRGCIVLTASGREEAREALAGVVPDAVLVGIAGGAGGLHAYEFARELRRLTEKKPALLVAVISETATADRSRLEQAGFDLRLTRPSCPDELLVHLAARRLQQTGAAAVNDMASQPSLAEGQPAPVA